MKPPVDDARPNPEMLRHWDKMNRYYAASGQWKRYIRIEFNLFQRLRVLFGQRVFVFFHDGTPPAHVAYVAPKGWNPDEF